MIAIIVYCLFWLTFILILSQDWMENILVLIVSTTVARPLEVLLVAAGSDRGSRGNIASASLGLFSRAIPRLEHATSDDGEHRSCYQPSKYKVRRANLVGKRRRRPCLGGPRDGTFSTNSVAWYYSTWVAPRYAKWASPLILHAYYNTPRRRALKYRSINVAGDSKSLRGMTSIRLPLAPPKYLRICKQVIDVQTRMHFHIGHTCQVTCNLAWAKANIYNFGHLSFITLLQKTIKLSYIGSPIKTIYFFKHWKIYYFSVEP